MSLRGFAVSEWRLLQHEGRDYVTLQNIGQFYRLGSVERSGNDFSLLAGPRSLRGAVNSAEFYINGLKFILSYPVVSLEGDLAISRMDLTKLVEPVLRPSRIQNYGRVDTIILDPGHGGQDNGATSSVGAEKTYTLDVAKRAKVLLEAAGFRVYLTRTSDVFIPLDERVQFANRHRNALFISIHFNSSGNSASGVETYTLAPRGVPSMAADGPRLSDLAPCPGNFRDAENIALACATHAALVYNSRLFDRGIKRARFVVIRDITVPGVLLECGFLSNPSDARKIASSIYRQQLARSIVQAVQNYRNAVGTSTARVNKPTETESKGNAPIVITPTSSQN